MSERGNFRGGDRRGGGGGGGRRGRGGGRGGGAASNQANQSHEKPKKENILDLAKYVNKQVNVKFNGGREGMFYGPAPSPVSEFACRPLRDDEADFRPKIVIGTLKGYDGLMNLVLDDVKETMRGEINLNFSRMFV